MRLNQDEVPQVGAVDRDELAALVRISELALLAVADDGTPAGFVLAIGPGAGYRSPNYRFFDHRGGRFLYVDRVVVRTGHRREGVAAALYDAVEELARSTGAHEVSCEVNIRPPNAASLAFHLSREFVEVARQDTSEGSIRVALLAKRVEHVDEDAQLRPRLSRPAALEEADLPPHPMRALREWIDVAIGHEVPEPTAMALATAGGDGLPDARMVLLRGADSTGVRFYTNYRSPKGRQLAERGYATGVLYWAPLERQVRIRGPVQRLEPGDSDAYFAGRPRDAQRGVWASEQSEPITDRAAFERRITEVAERFGDGEIPRPEHWGGYLLVPEAVEFWHGRPGRLHDRLRYRLEDGGWTVERLQP